MLGWLRRRTMQPLDLRIHGPKDFAGKTLVLDGRVYAIGACLRQDTQGHVHRLTNTVSNLCQHAIQIRPEYRRAPETARAASSAKAEATELLRASMQGDAAAQIVSIMTVRQVAGGSLELHEAT